MTTAFSPSPHPFLFTLHASHLCFCCRFCSPCEFCGETRHSAPSWQCWNMQRDTEKPAVAHFLPSPTLGTVFRGDRCEQEATLEKLWCCHFPRNRQPVEHIFESWLRKFCFRRRHKDQETMTLIFNHPRKQIFPKKQLKPRLMQSSGHSTAQLYYVKAAARSHPQNPWGVTAHPPHLPWGHTCLFKRQETAATAGFIMKW